MTRSGSPPPGGPTVPPASPDERRQLTVMFTDLVGSTDLASSMDPEDWHEILDAYQHVVAQVVTDHGGVVSQFQGDGVVAYFGYPQAVETAGQDALDAGLAVVAAVEGLGRALPPGVPRVGLEARAGVHTGLAVVASPRAGGVSRRADLFGEVPNLAARLQGAARPGQVVASDVTVSLAAGLFELEPLPPLTLKGIPRAVNAFRVVARNQARSRLEGAALAGFVPRPREWGWLEGHWEAARRGPARCVLLVGEPGIGKSRLAIEFGAAAGREGARWMTVFCGRAHSLSPLQPFEAVMGAVPTTPETVVAWLETQAGSGPVLLVVDDAQWADPSTLEVVEHLGRSGLAVLVVLTARPDGGERLVEQVPAERRMVVDRLSPEDGRAIVRAILGPAAVDDGAVDALVARADGVPLYLEEMARTIGADSDAAIEDVPPTLMEVITARLDRLGPTRRVAQVAAVLGREFDPPLLARIAGMAQPELDAHLQYLLDQAIVESADPGAPTLRFRHALIHETAYESLLRADRRQTHSSVADVLAERQPPPPPQTLARHLGAAGRSAEAVQMWRQAGRAARLISRFREAAGHEREILRLLPSLPDEDRDSLELYTRQRLAMCLAAADQGDPEALSEGLAAHGLARRQGRDGALLDTYMVLIPAWQARADYASIETALVEAAELAERIGQPWHLSILTLLDSVSRIWQGRLADALDPLADAFRATGMPLDTPLGTLPDIPAPEVMMRTTLRVGAALGFWLVGDPAMAWALADDAMGFAADRRVPPAQGVSHATAAIMAQLDGDRRRAAELAGAAAALPDDVVTLQWRQWGTAVHRWSGRAGGPQPAPPVPGPMLHGYFLALTAEDPAVGPVQAVQILDRALEAARASGERFCEAEILRVRGLTRLRAGDRPAGEQDLVAAAGTARAQGAVMLEIGALTSRLDTAYDAEAGDRLATLLSGLDPGAPSRLAAAGRAMLAAFP